jgi:hypothetical protein
MQIGALLDRAFNQFKQTPAPFLIGMIVVIVVNGVLGVLSRHASLIGAANWVVTTLLSAGLVVMAVKAVRGQPFDVPDIFAGFSRPVPYLVISLAVTAGVLACGIGVLVTSFLFMFAQVYAAQGADFKEALLRSKDIVLANTGDCVMLALVLFALIIGGALACGIGLFVTGPVAMLLLVNALDSLESRSRLGYRP